MVEDVPVDERVERRRGERSRLRTIVERMADGIIIVDPEGTIRFANPAAEVMFGRPAEELVNEPFGFPIVTGETSEIEVVRRGGEVVTAELRVAELDWEGSPGFLISLRDVTDRKLAAEKARELQGEQAARADAEAASQAKSEFLAIMSHELRTPLNAVLGYTDLLEFGVAGPLNEQQRQQLRRISVSGRHLLALVNEVLDLARIEAGRLNVERAPAPAADAADAAIVLIQPQAEIKGITLTRVSCGSDPVYVGDHDRVRQILVNLLSNAVKFTPAGGRIELAVGCTSEPEPAARLRGSDAWVYFRVTDTGVGIAPDQLEVIFAPFTQAQSGHTRNKDGTGLGLTISRRLARLMNGDLTVRSALGEGSSFTLWLPEGTDDRRSRQESREALRGREPSVEGLAEVGEALLRDIEPVLDAFVARLRDEVLTTSTRALHFSQLADHVGTLLADIAETLVIVEESCGEPSSILADGSEIQRLIADRHGAQRARLGWDADLLRQEYRLLREEIDRAIRRRFLGETDRRIAESIAVVGRLLEEAERVSMQALERAVRITRSE